MFWLTGKPSSRSNTDRFVMVVLNTYCLECRDLGVPIEQIGYVQIRFAECLPVRAKNIPEAK